jgi:hypothetical protein
MPRRRTPEVPMRYLASACFLCLLLVAGLLAQSPAPAQPAKDAPSHDRPYFMPGSERDRLRGLIAREEWARAEYARVKAAADKGDGYWAAFLFALDGDAKYVPAAQSYLLGRYGPKASWIEHARKRLADPNFFKGGQPGIPEIYYDIDISGMVAFDWAHKGLPAAERKTIAEGILTWARLSWPGLVSSRFVLVGRRAGPDNTSAGWRARLPVSAGALRAPT